MLDFENIEGTIKTVRLISAHRMSLAARQKLEDVAEVEIAFHADLNPDQGEQFEAIFPSAQALMDQASRDEEGGDITIASKRKAGTFAVTFADAESRAVYLSAETAVLQGQASLVVKREGKASAKFKIRTFVNAEGIGKLWLSAGKTVTADAEKAQLEMDDFLGRATDDADHIDDDALRSKIVEVRYAKAAKAAMKEVVAQGKVAVDDESLGTASMMAAARRLWTRSGGGWNGKVMVRDQDVATAVQALPQFEQASA